MELLTNTGPHSTWGFCPPCDVTQHGASAHHGSSPRMGLLTNMGPYASWNLQNQNSTNLVLQCPPRGLCLTRGLTQSGDPVCFPIQSFCPTCDCTKHRDLTNMSLLLTMEPSPSLGLAGNMDSVFFPI